MTSSAQDSTVDEDGDEQGRRASEQLANAALGLSVVAWLGAWAAAAVPSLYFAIAGLLRGYAAEGEGRKRSVVAIVASTVNLLTVGTVMVVCIALGIGIATVLNQFMSVFLASIRVLPAFPTQ